MGLFTTHHYHHTKETNIVPYEKKITINEHLAPTDESIRIFKELQEKAYKSVLSTIEIKSDYINAVAFFIRDNRMLGSVNIKCHIKFKLNDIEHFIEFEISEHEYYEEYIKHDWLNSKNRMLEYIHKKLSLCICDYLIENNKNEIIKFIETKY